ncbi:MAG: CdaR family protein [Desulfobacterales bacterium]|nr:CdaR family protein [Desulfobacterales bacterium]
MIRSGQLKWIFVLGLMGLCFVLLWPGMTTDEVDWYVPIEIENLPKGLIAIQSHPKGVEIRVRGPRTVVQTLSDQKIEYRLNLGDATPGMHAVVIDPNLIGLPKGLKIRSVNPSRFSVKIENEINKELPVRVSFQGEPAPGFFIADALAIPDAVVLRGPESVLAPLTKIETKPIDVGGLNETFRKEVPLDLAEGLDVVSASRLTMVAVTVAEKVTTKKMENVPIQGKNTRYRYRISPATLRIVVKGPAQVLEKLDAARDISVTVDLKGLAPGTYTKRAAFTLPVQATLVSAEPEEFKVTLTVR